MPTSSVAITGAGAATPRWWLAWRTPAPLARFRVVAALALVAHFGDHLRETVPLLTWSGLSAPLAQGDALRPSWIGSGLSPIELQCVFGSAMVLAAWMATGTAPRLCAAALYVLSVSTYRAILPVADSSDFFANVTTLFLALMPSGRRLLSARAGPPDEPRIPGLAVTIFLMVIAYEYLSGALNDASSTAESRHVADVARFIPIAFVLPLPGLRWVGVGLQLAVHTYLAAASHVFLAHIILAASGLLFWGETNDDDSRGWLIDAGAVVGAVSLGLLVLGAAPLRGVRTVGGATTRFLSDTGLLRVVAEATRKTDRSLSVIDEATGQRARLRGGARWQRVTDQIAVEDGGSTRLGLASWVAEKYCKTQGYWGFVGSLVGSDEAGEHRIFEFECGSGGALSNVR